MSILRGFAISVDGTSGLLEHTYVTSDDGFVWRCWGRFAGGHEITNGNGNSKKANCISQSDSHANIIYGVDGVCHQTANRILYPANRTVVKANGYTASFLAYGTYGTHSATGLGTWEYKKIHCLGWGSWFKKSEIKDMDDPYFTKINDLHLKIYGNVFKNMNINHEDVIKKEFEILLEVRLGEQLKTKNIINNSNEIIDSLLIEKKELINQLYNESISGDEYVKNINAAVSKALDKYSLVFTEADYKKLFDYSPKYHPEIIDLEIFNQNSKRAL